MDVGGVDKLEHAEVTLRKAASQLNGGDPYGEVACVLTRSSSRGRGVSATGSRRQLGQEEVSARYGRPIVQSLDDRARQCDVRRHSPEHIRQKDSLHPQMNVGPFASRWQRLITSKRRDLHRPHLTPASSSVRWSFRCAPICSAVRRTRRMQPSQTMPIGRDERATS